MRNGWLAFALLSAACVGAAVRPVVFPAVTAQAPRERCDWRYVSDVSSPSVAGADGRGSMDREWSSLSAAGYHLVTAGGSAGEIYVFERCVPAN